MGMQREQSEVDVYEFTSIKFKVLGMRIYHCKKIRKYLYIYN